MTDRAALAPALRSMLARVELRDPATVKDVQSPYPPARPLPKDYLLRFSKLGSHSRSLLAFSLRSRSRVE